MEKVSILSYAGGEYSQNGESNIIDEVLKRIGMNHGTAIEFGGADGFYCSNIAHLRNRGWAVIMYDMFPKSHLVQNKTITPVNVNDLPPCNILSIDIDGNDYNVWEAYKGQPDIVIIEINSSIPPDADRPVSDSQHGTAFKPMNELAASKGYFLLCHTGNCIYLLNKYLYLFPDRDETFNTKWLC